MNFNISRKDKIKDYFRSIRANRFKAFDVWEKNILMGREESDSLVYDWYQEMLDFPDTITEDTNPTDFPTTPEQIEKYLY